MPEDNTYKEGYQLYLQKKYKSAIRKFDKVIKKDPDFDLAWIYKGMSYYFMRKYDFAKKSAERALELNPSIPEPWKIKINILIEDGDYEEAIKNCQEALTIGVNEVWLQLAFVYEYRKNYKEALECAKKALIYDPSNKIIHRVKLVLENALKFGKYYYKPVTRSPLLMVIPPEDDIIYSTIMKITWRGPRKKTTRIGTKLVYEKFMQTTDVLMTHKGFALNKPYKGYYYESWSNADFSLRGKMTIAPAFDCKLIRDPRFETEETYARRYSAFHHLIINLRYKYSQECLEKARIFEQQNDLTNGLKNAEAGLSSNVKTPEKYNLYKELKNVKSTILEKQLNETEKYSNKVDEKLANYFNSNKGRAFTIQALLNRLEDIIEDSEARDYCRRNIENILARLIFNGTIKGTKKEGITYFFTEI
ncbi:MAG: tetratricopeptide repeat protein [Promethearchaeota archaeon]